MLEFCLEDGTRLTLLSGSATAESQPVRPTAAETVAFPPAKIQNAEIVLPQPTAEFETIEAKRRDAPLDLVKARGYEALGNVPIIIALAHNWWQWLYLEKQYVSSITEYVFSANFLMWLLLLISGVAVSLFVVRTGTKKTVAYTSLVILAINLILFLVPRR
ncbi:MAG TPA: hypothetical protein VK612_10290 [Pyrinomonadaceae bacterium]|nr:hypothetical protein [Pyrinomonadaceae bacterium]